MPLEFRPFCEEDLPALCAIWNDVVEVGDAFPQVNPLSIDDAREFFAEQSLTQVADLNGIIFGLYILHPNGIGRCAHVANASYAVALPSRGVGLGRELVKDSLKQAARLGFRGLQFNAVVASNEPAIHLYEDLGFTRVGTVPGGFVNGAGQFEDTYIFYKHCFQDLGSCCCAPASSSEPAASSEPAVSSEPSSETALEKAGAKEQKPDKTKTGKKEKKLKKAKKAKMSKKAKKAKKGAGSKQGKQGK